MLKKQVVIIGAGPSGLFCAFLLLKNGFKVTLIEKTGGAAKKYLIAGHSGLNITNTENLRDFISRYSPSPSVVTNAVENFPPNQVMKFYEENLDVPLFSGSTGHVFPKEMKAGKALLSWLNLLKSYEEFEFLTNAELVEIVNKQQIALKHKDKRTTLIADYFIYALGGGSWKKTGSAGDWSSIFVRHGIDFVPFHPENCGHIVNWSKHFKDKIAPTPLKNISLTSKDKTLRGELLINTYGVEGQLIYKFSHILSKEYKNSNSPTIEIDMVPDLNTSEIEKRLEKLNSKMSFSTRMQKAFKFSKGEILLINEFRDTIDFNNPLALAKLIKHLKLELVSPRPIDEAISTSGGISLAEIDHNFELNKLPSHFCLGEMLDWSAPTGGYLLTACMSTAYSAAKEIIKRN